MKSAKLLFLFDIDGTLTRRAGPHHRDALVIAARRVTGIDVRIDHVPVQGMLDPVILATMLRDAGAPASLIRRAMPAIIATAQAIYLDTCPRDLRSKVCPGARALLAKLRRKNIPAGLVTGNLSRIAWRKMRSAGLADYLQFGAFAESAATRAGLARLAMNHARRRGWLEPKTKVWLVGDHENDIAAAKANGIGVVSVATGLSPREDLAREHPDILIDDLRALPWDQIAR
jgi:phosphoglycolate phosphatase-like HAD superfamily hydrolase